MIEILLAGGIAVGLAVVAYLFGKDKGLSQGAQEGAEAMWEYVQDQIAYAVAEAEESDDEEFVELPAGVVRGEGVE